MKTIAVVLALLASCLPGGVEGQEIDQGQEPGPSQESGRPVLVSFSGGLGVGTMGLGGHASISASLGSGDYILGLGGTSEIGLFQSPESTEAIALLYGRRATWGWGWARAAVGPAWVRRTERGEVEECAWFTCRYELRTSMAAGLGGQVELVWTPSDVFGLGLTGQGNVNRLGSFGALTVGVHWSLVR